MNFGIDHNIGEFGPRLEKGRDVVRAEVLTTAQRLNRDMVDRARALASGPLVNVRTGRYRGSIRGSVSVKGDIVTGVLYANAPEARFIEYGAKKHITPRHVLETTIAEMSAEIGVNLQLAVNRGLPLADT